MADVILDYQRVVLHGSSETRRKVAWMLWIAAIGMLAFALVVGWEVFNRVVMERRALSVWSVSGAYYIREYDYVYHWDRLVWVGAALVGPLLVAGVYWFLGVAIQRRQDRAITITALALTILHTLAATLCLMLFAVMGTANVKFRGLNFQVVVQGVGCLLAVAMVPGMFYLSLCLMGLLKERVRYGSRSEPVEKPE